MRHNKRRLPIPQWEFGFAPETFNLILETGIDFARVAREREAAELAKEQADAAQARLFSQSTTKN
jgi:hypothetical protein